MRFADRLAERLEGWARGGTIVGLIVVFAAFQAVVLPRLLALPGGSVTSLDARIVYGPADVAEVAAAYGDAVARWIALYATWDLINPVAYAAILGLSLAWLRARAGLRGDRWRRLALLPVAAAGFDLLENVSIVALLVRPALRGSGLVALASGLTVLKVACLAVSALLVVGLAMGAVVRRLARPR